MYLCKVILAPNKHKHEHEQTKDRAVDCVSNRVVVSEVHFVNPVFFLVILSIASISVAERVSSI